MSREATISPPRHDPARVTAAEWFAGGQRILYDPGSRRVLTGEQAAAEPDRAAGLRARGRSGAGRGHRVAHLAARIPGRLLRLGAGRPDARRRRRPTAVRGAGRVRASPTSPGTTRTPPWSARTWSRRCGGTTACAAPSSSRSTTRRWPCSICCAARSSAPPRRHRRAGDHRRAHRERRPVRRRAHAPVARHPAAASLRWALLRCGAGSVRSARSTRAGRKPACTPAATVRPRRSSPSCGR